MAIWSTERSSWIDEEGVVIMPRNPPPRLDPHRLPGDIISTIATTRLPRDSMETTIEHCTSTDCLYQRRLITVDEYIAKLMCKLKATSIGPGGKCKMYKPKKEQSPQKRVCKRE